MEGAKPHRRLCTSWLEGVDHAPRSSELRWERRAQYYLLEIRSFLPFPRIFPGIVSGQRWANILDTQHGDSFSSGRGTHTRLARIPTPSFSPSPTAQIFLPFQIAHLSLERHFRNLTGLRVGRKDEYRVPQTPTWPWQSPNEDFKHLLEHG